MSLHKKIIALVALSMLMLMLVMVLSLSRVVTVFSFISGEMELASREMRRVEEIAQLVSTLSVDLHRFVATGSPVHRAGYETAYDSILAKLDELEGASAAPGGRMTTALRADIMRLAERSSKIFGLADPTGRDRDRAYRLIVESDSLIEWIRRDMESLSHEAQAFHAAKTADYVSVQKQRIVMLFVLLLLASFTFLLGFRIYIRRTLAEPLTALWKGAAEISQGNLEYRIKLQGTGDVAQLARRFNDMALQLKSSYAELEKKLLDRTNHVAAIDAVALTLSRAVSLNDMLSRSLARIIETMAHLEPRGGVFLCEPDGEALRLVAHQGISADFARQEETVRMGECLCGIVAQTGEIMYADASCDDPRRTRLQEPDARSHIIIPIKSRGIVLGVVFLYFGKAFTFKPSDLQMLDTFGAQIGMAVENLRLYGEVKESSEKFWELFENSRDILFTMDAAGTLTAVNKAAEKFAGYPKTELTGKNIFDFLTPEGAASARRIIGGEAVKQPAEYEVRRRDGTRAFLEASARKLVSPRGPAGYQVSARDITEQRAMRERLLQAERLGAIGEIVIAVRHEINNPLTTVIGNVELLLERYGDKDKALTARLETILNNSLRIAEIVKQLQAIRKDKVVEYVNGIPMTDLKQEEER